MKQSEDCRLGVARRYTKRAERLRIIESFRQSVLGAAQFAQQMGIPERTINRWSNEAVPVKGAPAFIELPAIATGAWTAQVTSKEGSVRFPSSACPACWLAPIPQPLPPRKYS